MSIARTRRGRRIGGFVSVAVLMPLLMTMLSSGVAKAAGPVVSNFPFTFEIGADDPWADCGPYGHDFLILADGSGQKVVQQYFEGGVETKEVRHVRYTGTLYRSDDPRAAIEYDGHFTIGFDFVTGTLWNDGNVGFLRPDGTRVTAVDSGSFLVSFDDPNPLRDVGTPTDIAKAACDTLAAL